ncbi:MAG: ATP-binding protein [Oscillospiraceae bacterium]|nr:ATP-binding protein [Oscillospiraceae bacterium]
MKEYAKLCLALKASVIFKNVLRDKAVNALIKLLDSKNENTEEFVLLYSDFVSALYEKSDNLTKYINEILQNDDNAYVKSCAAGHASPYLKEAAEHELESFAALADIKSIDIKKHCESGIFLPEWENGGIDIVKEYKQKISSVGTTGYGIYARYKMFLFKDGEIVPVKYPDPQRLSQMSGYENERQKVIDNTLALINGRPCSNILLYGDAGSGKSSTVKAVVNEYYGMGLRLIEVKKNQLYSLPDILERLADNPLKFIIFIDDLSFSSSDGDFSALKAILEGGAAGKAGNTVIYATSNRRNLVRESFGDRDGDDIHIQDTVQEIMSLSARFGLKITFSRPDKDLYLSIVENLSLQYNIHINKDELFKSAEAFALRNGGRSPRAAKQFIEYLASRENL